MNKCHFSGNLCADPETRMVNGDKQVTTFRLAVNSIVGKGGKKDTLFLNCEAWGKQAETISKYCEKGRPLIVHGRMRQEEWEDKNGGGKRTAYKLSVEDFEFMNNGKSAEANTKKETETVPASELDSDDVVDGDPIPF